MPLPPSGRTVPSHGQACRLARTVAGQAQAPVQGRRAGARQFRRAHRPGAGCGAGQQKRFPDRATRWGASHLARPTRPACSEHRWRLDWRADRRGTRQDPDSPEPQHQRCECGTPVCARLDVATPSKRHKVGKLRPGQAPPHRERAAPARRRTERKLHAGRRDAGALQPGHPGHARPTASSTASNAPSGWRPSRPGRHRPSGRARCLSVSWEGHFRRGSLCAACAEVHETSGDLPQRSACLRQPGFANDCSH